MKIRGDVRPFIRSTATNISYHIQKAAVWREQQEKKGCSSFQPQSDCQIEMSAKAGGDGSQTKPITGTPGASILNFRTTKGLMV
jgi:hypothetical protein